MELIYNTMKNVSMTSEEYRNRDKMNNYNDHMSVIEIDPISGNSRKNYIYLRNNYYEFEESFLDILMKFYNNIYIKDNRGELTHLHLGDLLKRNDFECGIDHFKSETLKKKRFNDDYFQAWTDTENPNWNNKEYNNGLKDDNLKLCVNEKYGVVDNEDGLMKIPFGYEVNNQYFSLKRAAKYCNREPYKYEFSFIFYIPKDEIQNYSNFKIEVIPNK